MSLTPDVSSSSSWLDSEVLPCQPRDLVPPACRGSSSGPLPGQACLQCLPREVLNPPQLTPLSAKVQWLYSQLLLSGWASHSLSKPVLWSSPNVHNNRWERVCRLADKSRPLPFSGTVYQPHNCRGCTNPPVHLTLLISPTTKRGQGTRFW